MAILFSNNASTTLATPITSSATSLTVATGTGSEFPNPMNGDYFCLTLNDAATGLLYEIMHVTARSADTMTIVRAQEGTTALAWNAGDIVANFWTAGSAAAMTQNYQLQIQSTNYAVDTGTTNNLVATLSPAPASLASMIGAPIRIKVANTVTGGSVLNLNGFGNVGIVLNDDTVTSPGFIIAGGIYEFIYNGTNFQCATWVDEAALQGSAAATLATAESFAATIGNRIFFTKTAGSGTFTFPSGVTAAKFILTGGGAGGAGCNSSVWASGAGGGAGATEILGLPIGSSNMISYTIGAGGAGGAGALVGAPGNISTVIINSVTYTAQGGSAPTVVTSGPNYFLGGGLGGISDGSGVNGGDGSDGLAASHIFTGNGGGSYWGGGRRAGACNSGSPTIAAALTPGAGGGGAYDPQSAGENFTGGAGAPGCLMIIY